VSALDLVLVCLAALSAIGGYRRGAILQAFGLLGLALGLGVGVLAAPAATGSIHDLASRVGVAVGMVLVAASLGNVLGWLAGSRVKSRLASPHAARTDSLVGSGLSIAAAVLATWFLALNLANGPFPTLAEAIDRSRVVALLDDALPAPPPLMRGLERAASLLGFPDAFVGLPPPPAAPVDDPTPEVVRAAVAAAQASTVEVLGDGCDVGLLSEGSGFVIAPGYVLTNAHVVAGSDHQLVIAGGDQLMALVVAYDASLDVAVLRVPDLAAPPLELAVAEVGRGTGGAVLGYPGGPPLSVSPGAVRAAIDAVGRDVYGNGQVRRRLYELQTHVGPGNSGGPFVLQDGRVAGIVFASSTVDDGLAYAITADQVAPLLDTAVFRTQSVGTGGCI
jgi:S1-C subfamily serine protease